MMMIRNDQRRVMSWRGRAMVGVLALFVVPGCFADAPQPQSTLREYSLMVGGVERWTSIYQPPDYRSGQPVVLLLHGGTQSMRKLFQRGGGTQHWLNVAERERILLLVPNATNATTGDAKGDKQNWNDLRPSDATGQTGADDVGFLMALLDWARDQYHYDSRRVYVTGASNGGMMTLRLLLEKPERFAAAAAFIASFPASSPAKPSAGLRVPLLLLNGTDDPLVQWQGGTIRGGRGATMPIELMVRWWQEVNGVANVRGVNDVLPDPNTNNSCHITRTTWTAQQPGAADVVFYRVDGGGHSLPTMVHPLNGGPLLRRIIGPECNDAEGAELAWTFFRGRTLRAN